MKELRDIKLDLLMGKENPIVNLFNQITNDLKIINCEVYHKEGIEFIYFSGDKGIFYQDCDYEEFWCNYDIYWSLFGSNLNLEHDDIQEVTKFLVEEVLKRELSTTLTINSWADEEVGEALKREVSTPLMTLNNVFALEVQDALKKEIATPDKMTAMVDGLVERSIKKIKNI